MKTVFNAKNFFISSDYHLSHRNILKYDNRPFKDINEHDEKIIKNHNEVISNEDDFFFLGDFCFSRDKNRIDYLMSRLNGNKYFIKGNHDHSDTRKVYQKYGEFLGEQISHIKIHTDDTIQNIVLNHFKMVVWDKSQHGAWHLYGHSHGSAEKMVIGKSMDVGIMQNNYYPFSFDEIKKIMNKREIHKIDHH